MPDNLVWGRALVAAMHALPPECTAVALVRHAEREPIPSFQENDVAALTPRGEADAYQLGRHLPAGRPIRLFHSPIGRCQMTAVRIAEGFRSVGGSA
ncbi:MAG TPA: histidine phosphatase family protein, partial [Armatimonadota bacterium]|nr:histidine phosphatase family protein [Armatimonadota bacterium]